MEINGVTIDDTFAEAFPTWICRVIITAVTKEWAFKAGTEATGFATSAIGCPCEAGVECYIPASETPDGRPGVGVLFCASKKQLKEQVVERLRNVSLAPTISIFGLHQQRKRCSKSLLVTSTVKSVAGSWSSQSWREYIGERNLY
jgi:formylmethanofuran--tetrahydromethanopterin N-formyltransferase